MGHSGEGTPKRLHFKFLHASSNRQPRTTLIIWKNNTRDEVWHRCIGKRSKRHKQTHWIVQQTQTTMQNENTVCLQTGRMIDAKQLTLSKLINLRCTLTLTLHVSVSTSLHHMSTLLTLTSRLFMRINKKGRDFFISLLSRQRTQRHLAGTFTNGVNNYPRSCSTDFYRHWTARRTRICSAARFLRHAGLNLH